MNLYLAFGNNPVNYRDPWGEAALTVYGNSRRDSKVRIAASRAVGSSYNSGHVWTELTYIDDKGKLSTINRGNYPASQGGYRSDADRNSNADFNHVFYVPDSQICQVSRELWTYDSFNPLDHNCVDSLEEVLDSAGIEHPRFAWPSDPAKVGEWLKKLKQRKQKKCP